MRTIIIIVVASFLISVMVAFQMSVSMASAMTEFYKNECGLSLTSLQKMRILQIGFASMVTIIIMNHIAFMIVLNRWTKIKNRDRQD